MIKFEDMPNNKFKLKIQNLFGKKFNKLTILNDVKIKKKPSGQNTFLIKVLCECGTEKYVLNHHILKNKTTSCGCHRRKQATKLRHKLEGKIFGFLRILEHVPNTTPTEYKCECSCGNKCIQLAVNLVHHRVVSCGNCGKFRNGNKVSGVQIRLHKMLNRGIINYKFGRKRIDVALVYKGKKIAIEYDGWIWHKNKQDKDLQTEQELLNNNWYILRIKSNLKLPSIDDIYNKLNLLNINNKKEEIILSDWGGI